MITNQSVNKELQSLVNKSYVNQNVLQEFLQQTNNTVDFISKNSPNHHFCCFFVPFDMSNQTVLLGHHIKADLWIPPGGHMEENESPRQTVIREFNEELNIPLDNNDIQFMNISITRINNTIQACKTHYDLWHVVYVNQRQFDYDKGEFYDMKWVPINDAVTTLASHRAEFKSILYPLITH